LFLVSRERFPATAIAKCRARTYDRRNHRDAFASHRTRLSVFETRPRECRARRSCSTNGRKRHFKIASLRNPRALTSSSRLFRDALPARAMRAPGGRLRGRSHELVYSGRRTRSVGARRRSEVRRFRSYRPTLGKKRTAARIQGRSEDLEVPGDRRRGSSRTTEHAAAKHGGLGRGTSQ